MKNLIRSRGIREILRQKILIFGTVVTNNNKRRGKRGKSTNEAGGLDDMHRQIAQRDDK